MRTAGRRALWRRRWGTSSPLETTLTSIAEKKDIVSEKGNRIREHIQAIHIIRCKSISTYTVRKHICGVLMSSKLNPRRGCSEMLDATLSNISR